MNLKITQIKDEDRSFAKVDELLGKGHIYCVNQIKETGEITDLLDIVNLHVSSLRKILKDDNYILILIDEEK